MFVVLFATNIQNKAQEDKTIYTTLPIDFEEIIDITTVTGSDFPIKVKTVKVEEKPSVEPLIVETHSNTNVISLGVCKLSAYCKENYPHICNDGDSTRTSTGTSPTVGRTVAVDPSVIPYGSQVIINGHTYIAEDCGGGIKGNRIDILFETHQGALNFGIQYAEVYYIPKEAV